MNISEARRKRTRRTSSTRVRADDYFSFEGGLNLVDTPLKIRPGEMLGCKNYEPGIRGGYSRVDGYERFDGRTKPSAASFTYMGLTAITPGNYPAVGDTVTGSLSGATGRVLTDVTAVGVSAALNADNDFSTVGNAVGSGLNWFGDVAQSSVIASDYSVISSRLRIDTSAPGTGAAAFSERMPVSALSRYFVKVTGQEISGTLTQYLGMVFYDSNGDSIVASSTPTSGWAGLASYFYFLLNTRFSATATDYVIDFGAGGTAQIPTGAETMALVWLSNFNGAGAAVNEIEDFAVYEYVTDPGLVVGRVTGAFVENDVISAASNFGTVSGDPAIDLAPDDTQLSSYQQLASDDLRTLITVVPGEGSILGVVPFNGTVYAWRNKTGGATAGMYQSSSSGWTEITPNPVINFDTGTGAQPSEGDTVTQLTSGATATIERIVITNGTAWASAVGYFVLSSITGTFDNTNALQVSAATVATSTSIAASPTLAPSGRYEFRIHNFFGHTNSRRLYGVDGQNKAFEFDDGGSGVYTQITTGMTTDTPTHIGVHQQALWLAFPGGSAQLSGDANPLNWSVVLGAGELAVGAEITGFLEEVGDAMFIMTEKRSYYITGRRGAYNLDEYNFETGSTEWTIQRIGQGMYLDQRAFSTLQSSDRFGNFSYNAFSEKVQPLVTSIRPLAISSCVSRRKNLYRCFFSDTRFISIWVRGRKITGITTCDYGIPVRCIESLQEGANGEEMIVFGSDDGYVYEADIGKSFDGGDIEAFTRVSFHYSRQPTRRKRYRQAAIDIMTEGAATLAISVDYTFASAEEPGNPSLPVTAAGGGGFWDISNWDQFQWSTGVVSTARFKLEGAGRNVGLLFYHNSAVEASHSIEGLTLHHSQRRIDRGTNA